jgi:hypothetical protein
MPPSPLKDLRRQSGAQSSGAQGRRVPAWHLFVPKLITVLRQGYGLRDFRADAILAMPCANTASALFGGMQAIAGIARKATNIKAGARSPVAGMLHAVFVLLFMVALAPLAAFIPLASLAAVLVVVAWNMSEIKNFATCCVRRPAIAWCCC